MPSAEPLEPEVLAALETIDATLHGEPVDPEHAELAELALILRDERPRPDPAFLARLDRRAAGRFAPEPRPRRRRRVDRGWWVAGATTLAVLCLALLVVVTGSHGGGSSGASSGASIAARHGTSESSAASSAAGAAGSASATSTTGSGPARAPAPRTAPGRDVSQSARVGLEARAGRIARVAQEVFNAVARAHGDVLSSHVTEAAGAPGLATFSLQVPAGRLAATLDRLSRLRDARVLTREDASADITSHTDNTAATLAGARARRRSLLRQLAATADPALAARLQREAARTLAQIDRAGSELARLRHQVTDSAISVTIQSPPVIHHPHRSTGGFTFARALHDAGRILIVAAGVALIALAVLVPLGLVVALCAWVWSLVLRRRREGALGPS